MAFLIRTMSICVLFEDTRGLGCPYAYFIVSVSNHDVSKNNRGENGDEDHFVEQRCSVMMTVMGSERIL